MSYGLGRERIEGNREEERKGEREDGEKRELGINFLKSVRYNFSTMYLYLYYNIGLICKVE